MIEERVDNERGVLSAVMFDYEGSERLLEEIDPEWFLHTPARQTFEIMRKHHKNHLPMDIGDILASLEEIDPSFLWGSFMASVMDTPLVTDIDRSINRLMGDYTARKASSICSEAMHTLIDSNDPMGDVSMLVRRLSTLKTDSNDSFVDAVDLTVSSYERIVERVGNEQAQGIPLGFKRFDSMCNIQGQMYIVISGRPSMGKTALMLTMARTQMNRGHKVGIFSLEMPRHKLDQRWIQMDTGINTVKMNRYGGLNDRELRMVEESCQMRAEWNLMIDDRVSNIDAVERKMRKMKALGAEIIYVDQLSKLRGAKGKEYERFSEYSNRIFDMTKELDMPIVLLAQLRRPQEGVAVKKPNLSNLKGTGSLEEDPDIVCFIHRPEYYAQTDEDKASLEGQTHIDFAKHRDGPVYEDTNIMFVKSHGMFTDGSREY